MMLNKAGFTDEQTMQVKNTISLAQKNGLPEDAIIGKVQEGIAKQIAPDRIILALKQITARYNHAHSLARNLVKEEKKTAQLGHIIAAGIAAGLTNQHAEKLVTSLNRPRRKTSLWQKKPC